MSEVTEALQELHDGQRTVEDVAELFRTRDWPTRADPAPTSFKEAAAEHDPDQPAAGSFSEVAFAYSAGIITLEQYTVLAKAAAEKINAQTGRTGTPADDTGDEPAEMREPGGQTALDDRTDRTEQQEES